jgi:predicted transposase YbfD/YdcC
MVMAFRSWSVARHFAKLPDPRVRRRCRHQLIDIVVIAICGVICGADDWQEIELFGRHREAWLRRFLALPHGVPSHDTFERVFDRIDPEAFHACFQQWVQTLADLVGARQIAIDGKTLCGSANAGIGALQVVSAWATAQHLTLGQVAVEPGGSELAAIPKLLQLLDLQGALVTIDALGCQKNLAQQIITRGGDYALVVKDNQPKLLQAIQTHLVEALDDVDTAQMNDHQTDETGHGRREQRSYTVCPAPEHLRADWPGLQMIGMCLHERTVQGKTSTQARYFIGSRHAQARYYGRALRHHWGIENSLHWQMDVTFGEDDNRCQRRHGATHLALLRRLSLALLKQHPSKQSIKCKRFAAALDLDFLQETLRGPGKTSNL